MAHKNPFNINLSKSKIEHSLAVLEKMTHEASGFNVGSAARTVDQVVRVISKVLGEGRQAELHDLNLIRDLSAAVDRWSASESNHERQGIYYHFI